MYVILHYSDAFVYMYIYIYVCGGLYKGITIVKFINYHTALLMLSPVDILHRHPQPLPT